MSDEKAVAGLIEELVDKGATTVEEIHRAIADLPISVLENLGLLERTTRDVRRIQDTSIGAIYDTIREVNHKVADLAGDVLERTGELLEQAGSEEAAENEDKS